MAGKWREASAGDEGLRAGDRGSPWEEWASVVTVVKALRGL
jgi:hypothetical protein